MTSTHGVSAAATRPATQQQPGAASGSGERTLSRDDWRTPEWILERVRRVGPIGLDPCTTADNPVDACIIVTKRVNGLGPWPGWPGLGLAYVNPPFTRGAIDEWTKKIVKEASHGDDIVILTPVDATKWWRRLAENAAARATPWRRVNYVDPDTSDTVSGVRFPSALHYFGTRPHSFCAAFEDVAETMVLP